MVNNFDLNKKLYTNYPKFIKMTNLYIMYEYSTSGVLEISHLDSDFKMIYVGYGRRDAVRIHFIVDCFTFLLCCLCLVYTQRINRDTDKVI